MAMNTDALKDMGGKVSQYPPTENQPETQVTRQFAYNNQFQYTLRDSELLKYRERILLSEVILIDATKRAT